MPASLGCPARSEGRWRGGGCSPSMTARSEGRQLGGGPSIVTTVICKIDNVDHLSQAAAY